MSRYNRRCMRVALTRSLLVLSALGLLARAALLSLSLGSSDAQTWQHVGEVVADEGLLHAYQAEFDCNQPPGQPLWAALCVRLSRASGVRFAPIFKAPLIACEAVVLVLLWKILRPR